jgi:hypothetical protein
MPILPVRYFHILLYVVKLQHIVEVLFFKCVTEKMRDSEDNCWNQIGGFEGLPSPGSLLAAPARSATCWRG